MSQIPTPFYCLKDFPNVYEPSEDTHLFLDALEKEQQYIVNKQPLFICEIGSGSGILITALATMLKGHCCCFATDVNPEACKVTKLTAKMNQSIVESVEMNLTNMFRCKFDLIIFNPPYVVTDSDEIGGRGLNRAYAGGMSGREIIDKFLNTLPTILSNSGACYLLLLKENNIDEIKELLQEYGYKNELVIQRKIPGEHLFVYKFFK
ncbi:hypothetical protein ABEB36_007351 [Hypothenemus hampei]|uniref:Methyltransferase HEMK2 n=1 Tax=Hypothenemus hampei TaxID=57062 RepID=A0ABD1ETV3_HYPHA